MKHDARGNARLILRGPVQVRVDAIDLEDANRDERSHTPVDATAHRACPRCARAKIVESAAQKWVLRLPGEADQSVSEGREFHSQRDLRAKQIRMFTGAGAIESAVSSVEIHNAPKESRNLYCAENSQPLRLGFCATCGGVPRLGGQGVPGAKRPRLADFDRGAQIGVATEEFDLSLAPWRRSPCSSRARREPGA